MILKCFVNDSEMLFNNFEKPSNDFEMFFFNDFFNDLSSRSKNFGSNKKQRGSAPRPPLFFERPKIVQTGA